MVLKPNRVTLESRGIDHMRHDPPPFLFRREPAGNGVEPRRVKPFPRLRTINHGIRLLGLPRPLQLAIDEVRRIEKRRGALLWGLAEIFFQPEVNDRPRRNLKTDLLKRPISQRYSIQIAMRWRHRHMYELLLVPVVNNFREGVIVRLHIGEANIASRRDRDLTLFFSAHQLNDDVLLQNLIIVERTRAAVK